MKYSLIEIRRSEISRKFKIYFKDMPYDRKKEDIAPKPVGFYYFPTSKRKEIAFQELKKCMIEKLLQEIEDRKKAIKQLEILQYES